MLQIRLRDEPLYVTLTNLFLLFSVDFSQARKLILVFSFLVLRAASLISRRASIRYDYKPLLVVSC